MDNTVRILGTHGVPAAYGGFETAAENVALYLVKQGWNVVVYCQEAGRGPLREDRWRGMTRVTIPVDRDGWLGTSQFDLKSIRHAVKYRDLCLVFGYNTAVLNTLQRIRGIPLVINMDGIEWSRERWGKARQAILYANERIACLVGNDLIADHPEIEVYLRRRAPRAHISMITYGAHAVEDSDIAPLAQFEVSPQKYLTLICRPIPENSILEIVRGFARSLRGIQLLVLGDYTPESDDYHRQVMDAASDEVSFPGAVYDPATVQALRFHSALYLHGHTVGGTNPSLVEAMAAGNPVLAHDNPYNRWTAGAAAEYFTTAESVDSTLSMLLDSPDRLEEMRTASRARHASEFTWEHVAGQYEALLRRRLALTAERETRT